MNPEFKAVPKSLDTLHIHCSTLSRMDHLISDGWWDVSPELRFYTTMSLVSFLQNDFFTESWLQIVIQNLDMLITMIQVLSSVNILKKA